MFLKIVYLYIVVVSVFGAPPTDVVPLEKQQPTVIPILLQSEELESNGTLKYSYETANGIKREETSYDKVLPKTRSGAPSDDEEKSDESNEIHVQQGSYSYTAPDGTLITVRYIADENGFRPIGDHLPKPPSIIAASSARVSDLNAMTIDNAESGSAPAMVAAAAPSAPVSSASASSAPAIRAPAPSAQATSASAPSKAPKVPGAPKVESRIAELAPNETTSTPASEVTQALSTTPEAPSTTEVPSTTEPVPSSTESVSTTIESVSTTTESVSTTTEPVSTTTEQATSAEVSSTAQPSTTGAASTPEEPTSTPVTSTSNTDSAESTPSSGATTEAATTVSA